MIRTLATPAILIAVFGNTALSNTALSSTAFAATRARTEPAKTIGTRTNVYRGEKEARLAYIGFAHPLWNQITHGVSLTHELAFDDAGVLSFTANFARRFDPSLFKYAAPGTKVALLRIFARAAELEQPVAHLDEERLNRVIWPQTGETARVLRRVADAYGLDEQKIKFADSTLVKPSPPKGA